MKGLVYKDLIAFKSTIKAMLFMMLLYIVLGVMSGDGTVLYVTMAVVFTMMVPLTCAAYDEQCGWDLFGNSLPVSRAKTVIARYMTGIIVTLCVMLVIAAAQLIGLLINHTSINFYYFIVIIAVSQLIHAIMNPIIYKFGAQKSRFVMMAVFLVPSLLVLIMTCILPVSARDWFIEYLDTFVSTMQHIPATAIALIALLISTAVYVISIFISISIYKKKDF